jgi:hypothetical protein
MVFSLEVFHVLQEGKGLRVFEVENTSERAVVDWLEVTVSAVGRVVLVKFLEVVACSPSLVRIDRVR